jgi:hypothetical protein
LAADEDFWVPAGVVDPNGNSGSYVGSQVEMRLRFDVIPDNVRLEAGYAHLFAGEFIDDAPNSNDQGDSDYVYTQISIDFGLSSCFIQILDWSRWRRTAESSIESLGALGY